jgi:hypothetical protein
MTGGSGEPECRTVATRQQEERAGEFRIGRPGSLPSEPFKAGYDKSAGVENDGAIRWL